MLRMLSVTAAECSRIGSVTKKFRDSKFSGNHASSRI